MMELSEIEKARPCLTQFMPNWLKSYGVHAFSRMMHAASMVTDGEVASEFELLRDIYNTRDVEGE